MGGGFSTMGYDSPASAAGGGFSLGKGAGLAGALAGGAFGIYSGVHAGGAQGALTATGSGLAMAGTVMALLDPVLKMAGPIGMIAGLGLSLVSSFLGDPKQNRANAEQSTMLAARYTAPTPTTYQGYGASAFSTDISGNMRPIVNVTVPVQTFDSKSFQDHMGNIVDVVSTAIENHYSTRLETAMKSVAGVPR